MDRRRFIKGSAILGLTLANNAELVKHSGMYGSNSNRKIYKILDSQKVMVGTLPVMRAFAGDRLDYVSPYVLFDEFGPVEIEAGTDALKVEAHPHAGVTPTTYFVEGTGHHKDSLNYDFQIGKGDFMMFSSGKGAIHMEESGHKMVTEGGVVHGFQIWLNTPAKHKWDNPFTAVHKEQQMGRIEKEGCSIQIVLGELYGEKSQVELLSPAFYYHVKLKADKRIDIPTDPTHNAFIYQISGTMELEGQKQLKDNQVVLYQRGESIINLYAETDAEFLVLGGAPLNEPVFSYGPFVMNNEDEIRRCIQNYNSGLMGDPELVNR